MSILIENKEIKQALVEKVKDFQLPRYEEIPDVGLYLDQVVRYVNRYFPLCSENEITPSMVSNYVKHKIINGPKKKCYGKESIARLIFVCYMKMVSPLEDIRLMEERQNNTYPLNIAYDYFCEELENMLQHVFGMKPEPDEVGKDHTLEKELLRSAVLAVTHKLYLDNYFRLIREYAAVEDEESEV
ncbi:MAG: DUF1836 domain-containing protein [Eubacteriales bacterium]|nr:DUF1836 domain-containing protein [Eubacteriales bacterium]